MSDDLFDEDFFGNAFKFLQVPKRQDYGEEGEEYIADKGIDEDPERPHFSIRKYEKKAEEDTPRILDPEHPLLEKFQKALKEHLLKQIDNLNGEVFALETGTKKKDVERENLGIEAYEIQQLVCKQQRDIENYMLEIQSVAEAREELDNQISEISEEFAKQKDILFDKQKREKEMIYEVETLNHLIKQMSQWEKEIESELQTKQTMSDKTRKDKLKLAAEKRDLDMIIYKRMTDIWRLENEIETMNMQLRTKEEERERLAIAVALSNTDIEALETEQKCLQNSWNAVILAIGTRDKTCTALQKELHDINEQIKSTINERKQVEKLCQKEMFTSETLTMFKNRVETDLKNCVTLLENEYKKRDELEVKINAVQCIIEENDKALKRVEGENSRKEIEHNILMKEFEKLSYEKIKMEEKIVALLQDQITNDKASNYLSKLVRDLREKNTDMEITLANSENQIARVLMDIEAQIYLNDQADRVIADLDKEQKDLDKEINQITTDIEKAHFIMRRKQREFDILSKKYESVRIKNATASNSSTYDKQMRDLEKEIDETEVEKKRLQKYWLREQENMVVLTQQRQEQIRDNNLLRKQVLILDQKNLKIGDELEFLKKQEDKMTKSITSLLRKQGMLQEAFHKKRGGKDALDKDNLVLQSEYLCTLQEAELDALRMEAEIEEMEEAKVNLSRDLIEKNREALAWEKKIQLVVETKQNMKKEDSSEGEMGNMKAEIHRMQVRHSQLKKAQEKLIKDLESCIIRREAIVTGAEARDKKGGESKQPKINFQRKMDDYKNKIKKVQMEIEDMDKQIEEADLEEKRLKKDIQTIENNIQKVERRIVESQDMIEMAKTNKSKTLATLVMLQKKLYLYQDITKGKPLKSANRSPSQIDKDYDLALEKLAKISSVIENLRSAYPEYDIGWERALNSLECFLDVRCQYD